MVIITIVAGGNLGKPSRVQNNSCSYIDLTYIINPDLKNYRERTQWPNKYEINWSAMILTKNLSTLHFSGTSQASWFFFTFQISMTENEQYVANDHKSTTPTTHTIPTLYILWNIASLEQKIAMRHCWGQIILQHSDPHKCLNKLGNESSFQVLSHQ